MPNTGASAGGKATAVLLRRKAIEGYYANPRRCLQCNKIITIPDGVKVGNIKRKKFCNHSCAARYNNSRHPKLSTTREKSGPCLTCGVTVYYKRRTDQNGYRVRRYCGRCIATRRKKNGKLIADTTKGELFKQAKNWRSARTAIQQDARKTYFNSNRSPVCKQCGYDIFVEVAHIKPCSEFSDDTPISIINHIDNLMTVCPNHHWEHDHGL